MTPKKSERYTIRLTPEARARYRRLAARLGTTLPEVIRVGVLIVHNSARTEVEWLDLKARTLEKSLK
jgi:predicted DNA-binding protein